ncbi:TPA: capsid protein, partial [Clostridioides difficile]|nr:capsid protein [Clostridioides difficile]
QYSTADPVAKWIKAVATALPSFPYADQVFMGTIN